MCHVSLTYLMLTFTPLSVPKISPLIMITIGFVCLSDATSHKNYSCGQPARHATFLSTIITVSSTIKILCYVNAKKIITVL